MRAWEKSFNRWMKRHSTQMGVRDDFLARAMFLAGQRDEQLHGTSRSIKKEHRIIKKFAKLTAIREGK